jgi:hypothetical protein
MVSLGRQLDAGIVYIPFAPSFLCFSPVSDAAVTEHLDLEFQELAGACGNSKAQQEWEGNS